MNQEELLRKLASMRANLTPMRGPGPMVCLLQADAARSDFEAARTGLIGNAHRGVPVSSEEFRRLRLLRFKAMLAGDMCRMAADPTCNADIWVD